MKVDELLEYTKLTNQKKVLGNDTIEKFLKEKCSIAYNLKTSIYRGIPSDGTILFGDSSEHIRKSANTKNYYTLLIDYLLPAWKDYPKRSRSFICTNNIDKTMSYGTTYQVYPIGNPLVAICSHRDIWDSFKYIDLTYFTNLFAKLYRIADLNQSDTLLNIKKLIKKLDSSCSESKEYKRIIYDILMYYVATEVNIPFRNFINVSSFLKYCLIQKETNLN